MTRVWWVAFQVGRFGIGLFADGRLDIWTDAKSPAVGVLIGHTDPVPTSQET
jgi:hypothetical protein